MTHAALTVDHVSKTYRFEGSNRLILDDIAFAVGQNEILSIVGASGCGKSTLLRLIVGLDKDYRGSIIRNRQGGYAAKLGMVFQDHRLYPWMTVEANVGLAYDNSRLSSSEQRERVGHFLSLVGLSQFRTAYPRQLSGGMAQRAAIARALAQEPDILLMDEPFGALDSILRMRLQDELLTIWQQSRVSIVIVTHDVEEALYLSDRVMVMRPNPGRIHEVIQVDLPRPRDRGWIDLVRLKQHCLSELL